MGRQGRFAAMRTYAPLALGVAGSAALVLMVDVSAVPTALERFNLRLAPLLLVLAIADYGLRFLRWRWLVAESTGSKLPLAADIAVFQAANTLLLTPARAGDFTRSLWARDLFGTPLMQTAPIALVERVADVAVMAGLMVLGAIVLGPAAASGFFAPLAVLCLAVAAWGVSRLPPVKAGIARLWDARPAAASIVTTLHGLWRRRPLAVALGLGLAAWAIECAMFFVVLTGLGLPVTPRLLAVAAFAYPAATLAGSVSMLPGGLGITEASTAALTLSFTGTDMSTAVAAALLIRLAIVGFGIVTGVPGLIYVACSRAPSPRPSGPVVSEEPAPV